MELKSQIESLLFVSIKALSLRELGSTLNKKDNEIKEVIEELNNEYKERKAGLTIVENNKKYQLSSNPENAQIVKEFLKDESSGELSQPSLEALTIIAYRGPISKLEIERIRGVNCSLILRNLLIRGLIEESFDKKKQENYYSVSHDFVRFLGLDSIEKLPDYLELNKSDLVSEFLNTVNKEEGNS
ncbi:MAG: SMC-Scp complex subunit ScpB [Patescibacteria group bacterium]|jgi:segregation and condensation protein B|nr:SMC-Scp complex subunit ScpB [Patescibacteria group bacterium]